MATVTAETSPPFDITTPIGILDPQGLRDNPLTGRPYANLSEQTNDRNTGKPMTYANIAADNWTKLSVYKQRHELLQKMQKHQIVIAKSGTGSGKTVIFPKLALHVGGYKKKVLCAIPKQLITKSSAVWAAKTLDVKLGQEVGYFFKGDSRNRSNRTMLTFTTTGSVNAIINGDPTLSEYDYLVIDEAHERSSQMDRLLGLLKDEVCVKRPSLRVLIMSATIKPESYIRYLPAPKYDCVAADIEGDAPYPRELIWRDSVLKNGTAYKVIVDELVSRIGKILDDPPLKNDTKLIAKLTAQLRRSGMLKAGQDPSTYIIDGDIIAFVPAGSYGTKVCEELHKLAPKRGWKPFFCTKLESKSAKPSSRVFDSDGKPVLDKDGKPVTEEFYATDATAYKTHPTNDPANPFTRKLVITTDVAESSVTINGATYVVDSAIAMSNRYFPDKMMNELKADYVARDAITQRQGRVGRSNPGVVYHLYTKEQFDAFSEFTTPEYTKEDLTSDVLSTLSMPNRDSIGSVRAFFNELLDPPDEAFIHSAQRTLTTLGALTTTNGRMDDTAKRTMLGRAMSFFTSPITPQMAKAIVLSRFYKCEHEIAQIVAMLDACKGKAMNEMMLFDKKKMGHGFVNGVHKDLFSKYGDLITMLHAYQRYKHSGDERKSEVCRRYNLKIEFFAGVGEVSRKIIDKLTDIFARDDRLATITDDDKLDNEALENAAIAAAKATKAARFGRPARKPMRSNKTRSNNTRDARRTHKSGGSFDVEINADAPHITNANASGALDLDVLYALYPTANTNAHQLLLAIATQLDPSLAKLSPNDLRKHVAAQYCTPERVQQAFTDRFRRFDRNHFDTLSVPQQERVLKALQATIAHREREDARQQQPKPRKSSARNSIDRAADTEGHAHWLSLFRTMQRRAHDRLRTKRNATRTQQNARVQELIGRHIEKMPSDLSNHVWNNKEFRVLRVLAECYYTNIAEKTGNNRFLPLFPINRSVRERIALDESSVLSPAMGLYRRGVQSDVCFYEQLFKNPSGQVSLQMVTVLPAHVRACTEVRSIVERSIQFAHPERAKQQQQHRTSARRVRRSSSGRQTRHQQHGKWLRKALHSRRKKHGKHNGKQRNR